VVLATHMVLPGGTQPLWGTVRGNRTQRQTTGSGDFR